MEQPYDPWDPYGPLGVLSRHLGILGISNPSRFQQAGQQGMDAALQQRADQATVDNPGLQFNPNAQLDTTQAQVMAPPLAPGTGTHMADALHSILARAGSVMPRPGPQVSPQQQPFTPSTGAVVAPGMAGAFRQSLAAPPPPAAHPLGPLGPHLVAGMMGTPQANVTRIDPAGQPSQAPGVRGPKRVI